MCDYKIAKKLLLNLPKFYLGQEVETELGVGIIVDIRMNFNGLYLEPESSRATVWYGSTYSKNGWISYIFNFNEIKPYLKNERKEKIKKIEKI